MAIVLELDYWMPRIQAEESLLAVKRAWIGGGLLEKDEADKTLTRWSRAAGLTKKAARKATAAGLQSIGIGHRRVKVGVPKSLSPVPDTTESKG